MLPRRRPCRHSSLRSSKKLAVVRAEVVVEIVAAPAVTESPRARSKSSKTRREVSAITTELCE